MKRKLDLKSHPAHFLLTIALLVIFSACSSTPEKSEPEKHSSSTSVSKNESQRPVELLSWNSDESIQRFSRSRYNVDFFPLSNHFTSQDNGLFCALASSSIVLNALQLRSNEGIPVDQTSIKKGERKYLPEKYDPFFKKYTQVNVLNKSKKKRIEVLGKPKKIKGESKSDYGLQLHQLTDVLRSNGAKVTQVVVSDDLEESVIKSQILRNLKTRGDFVLVNYARKTLGQKGGGHVSPLGAYDEASDSFLVMDVNPNKADWVWVNSADLIRAMRTFDTVSNRGYLLISN